MKTVQVTISEADNLRFERARYEVTALENIMAVITTRMDDDGTAFRRFLPRYMDALKELDRCKADLERDYMTAYPARVRWVLEPETRVMTVYLREDG